MVITPNLSSLIHSGLLERKNIFKKNCDYDK